MATSFHRSPVPNGTIAARPVNADQPAAACGLPDGSLPAAHAASLRTDADLIEQFLRERCSRSEHTESAYRSSLRRLGWFCRHIGLASIRELQRSHWAQYQAYLRNPPPEHVMAVSVGYGHPAWAPFRGRLSDKSAKQSEIIAKAFFEWLADPAIGALTYSPVSSIRTHSARRSATAGATERHLTDSDWSYIEQAIDEWPTNTVAQRRGRARARWIVALAVRTGLRASEIAQARACDLRPSTRHAGKYNLHIVRKGGVEARLPVLAQTLSHYREHLALYELEHANLSDAPLVLPVRDADLRPPIPSMSRSHVWRIVKEVMLAASDAAMQEGDEASQVRLRSASTHWLRHTFANTLLDKGADLRSVRDLMDHASITTTNQYLHRPEDRLREDLERLGD